MTADHPVEPRGEGERALINEEEPSHTERDGDALEADASEQDAAEQDAAEPQDDFSELAERWRAGDQDDEVVDVFLWARRARKAAKRSSDDCSNVTGISHERS